MDKTSRHIVDKDGVQALAQRARSAAHLALSCETNEMHAYRARVCLLSVSVDGALHAIDAVALRGKPFPLGDLRGVLEDPGRRILVHGGEYLVSALKREYDLALAGVWDAQQAAALLDWPETGLRALALRVVGARLGPPVSVDWSHRPLTDALIDHALDDVRHLPAVAEALQRAISDKDLEDELAIQDRAVERTPADVGAFHPLRFYSLPGAARLDEPALRVLRALYLWRDATARRLDIPPGRLMPNPALVDLARYPHRALVQIGEARFHSRLLYDDREALKRAIVAAQRDAEPLPERPVKPPPTRSQRARDRALKRWRAAEARRRDVSPHAILPKPTLAFLARRGVADLDAVPLLGRRRRERYGDTLLALAPPDDEP